MTMLDAREIREGTLIGWKEIAAALGCSERRARDLLRHGLPVGYLASRPYVLRAELEAWLAMRRTPTHGRPRKVRRVARKPLPLRHARACQIALWVA